MIAALQSGVGLVLLVALAWAISEHRRGFDWRMAFVALGSQIGLAFLFLRVPVARDALHGLNGAIDALQSATAAGTTFVFGYLGGGEPPFMLSPDGESGLASTVIFAFSILPLVIVVSALAALLWHWRVLPLITRGFALILRRTLRVSGAVGTGSAANLFLGMVEAPLLIRAYIPRMSRSDLFVVMTVGLATIAGTVLVLYASVLGELVEGAVGHILTASIISLPAAILIAKTMIPGNPAPDTGQGEAMVDLGYASSMDAVTRGTEDGLRLFLNIAAMLLVVVALVALADQILALAGDVAGGPLTLQRLFGWIFAPLVLLFGVPMDDAFAAGAFMGTKAILNEFVAYLDLAASDGGGMSERSVLIMTYALCGFANLGSVGMMISAFSTLAPERRAEIAELGIKAFISGNLATGMTGATVGLLTAF